MGAYPVVKDHIPLPSFRIGSDNGFELSDGIGKGPPIRTESPKQHTMSLKHTKDPHHINNR